MANDVSYTKKKMDESSRKLDRLSSHIVKTSCEDISIADLPATPVYNNPGVTRQNSMEGVFAIFPPSGKAKRVICYFYKFVNQTFYFINLINMIVSSHKLNII